MEIKSTRTFTNYIYMHHAEIMYKETKYFFCQSVRNIKLENIHKILQLGVFFL